MANERAGLVGDARGIASDAIRMVRTRLELIAIEVQREKALVVRQLIVASATLFLLSFGTLLAILGLALALPEESRMMVLGGLGAGFLVAGTAGAVWLARKGGATPLSTTIDTLRQDETMLRGIDASTLAPRGGE